MTKYTASCIRLKDDNTTSVHPAFIGMSLSELHYNVQNGTVVCAQRTTGKNRIATHYCGLIWWFMYKKTQ